MSQRKENMRLHKLQYIGLDIVSVVKLFHAISSTIPLQPALIFHIGKTVVRQLEIDDQSSPCFCSMDVVPSRSLLTQLCLHLD
jgi:hypothetical protein